MKIIIVGAVAGGATVASQIRRTLPDAEITVYEKGRDMSFANCGLPYYLGNEVQERNDLLQASAASFKHKKEITVKLYHEITAVDTDDQSVTIYDHLNGETSTDHYDKLILSPGCQAIRLPQLQGSDISFPVRTLEDTDIIEQHIEKQNVSNVLVIGAGYISLEMVENLKHRGLDVTLLHRNERLLKTMDAQFLPHLTKIIDDQNIKLQLNDEVASIDGQAVTFKSGLTSTYDLIIEAVGIEPNTEFLQDSGIELNDKGYIKTDAFFQASAQNVFALGDAIETFYRHTGEKTTIALAWGAHRAAAMIAAHLAGDRQPFQGLLGTNIIRFFDHAIASVGISEQEVENYDAMQMTFNQYPHARYMEQAHPMHISVYYRADNRQILRACFFGKQGVDKRVDIIATAMINGMTVDDLKDIEIAYAPPFSSPKDIINMIGYRAK
ncbi:CoA-disulfide reductase [Macrococcus hajekii]|uniref:CoA-disulfide reductase n=1 Tax=Macrococcus hajekii TaxID=198482 RepID=A0A4R6BNK7_9STAP|nr:CoA-disulfide reductase [Macrococcus hajekii]TDM03449.1 CoA-disulfide reductase [Macrococcus hajekii]GGA98974.1 coenzyme A disulfide reductase [Macrococcus hajekii]